MDKLDNSMLCMHLFLSFFFRLVHTDRRRFGWLERLYKLLRFNRCVTWWSFFHGVSSWNFFARTISMFIHETRE